MGKIVYLYNLSLLRYVFQLLLFSSVVLCFSNNSANLSDEYLKLNQNQCFISRKLFSCFKYKIARAFWGLATNRNHFFLKENTKAASDSFSFVQMGKPSGVEIFENARDLKDDSEVTRAWKFFKRTLQLFLQGHGVELPVLNESGVKVNEISQVDDESRGKKRKWQIILPLITLMKLMHLKFTTLALLIGSGGIQLLALFGVVYIIHYLKANTFCKIHPYMVESHSHHFSPESDYSSFSGHGYHHGHLGGSEYAGYNKDWGAAGP